MIDSVRDIATEQLLIICVFLLLLQSLWSSRHCVLFIFRNGTFRFFTDDAILFGFEEVLVVGGRWTCREIDFGVCVVVAVTEGSGSGRIGGALPQRIEPVRELALIGRMRELVVVALTIIKTVVICDMGTIKSAVSVFTRFESNIKNTERNTPTGW
jgi:hypothetical protein